MSVSHLVTFQHLYECFNVDPVRCVCAVSRNEIKVKVKSCDCVFSCLCLVHVLTPEILTLLQPNGCVVTVQPSFSRCVLNASALSNPSTASREKM
jgi:hypothetical protein